LINIQSLYCIYEKTESQAVELELTKCYSRTQNTQWLAVAFAACPLISPALYQALALLTALLSLSLLIVLLQCSVIWWCLKKCWYKVNSMNETLSPFQ